MNTQRSRTWSAVAQRQKRNSRRSHSNNTKRRDSGRRPERRNTTKPTKPKVVIPEVEEGVVRVIPLGGVEEIGRNMTAIEYGKDILVLDCGIQFTDEETPGVDYILPNVKYLEENKSRVKALIITHGHLDHIVSIPYVIHRICNPPI